MRLMLVIAAAADDGTGSIVTAIKNIQADLLLIASALVAVMIMVAGLLIIIDRDVATNKRSERLAFIRSILIGYGIILGANFLITLLTNIMTAANLH